MAKFIARRSIVAAIRLVGIALVLLALVEFSYCVLGGGDKHVWDFSRYSAEVAGGMIHQGSQWIDVFVSHFLASLLVVAIAFGVIVLVGYSWGILGARLRRIGLIHFLTFLFGLLGSVPGFWFITLIVVFSLFHWNRLGFADELSVAGGFDYLSLWHASVLAVSITFGLLAWQLKAVWQEICSKASAPYVKALYIRGQRSDAIFYRNIFKQSISGLVFLFEKTLAPLLGSLIAVEWAYRYHGLGTLLVESARQSHYEGILLSGFGMSGLVVVMTLFREVVEPILDKKKV